MDTQHDLVKWLTGSDTGASSKFIVRHMETGEGGSVDYPLDGWDLGRCIRLLDLMPSYRSRLPELSRYGKYWELLIDHWEELESLYREELPKQKFPRCWKLMVALGQQARDELRELCKQRGHHEWQTFENKIRWCSVCTYSEHIR